MSHLTFAEGACKCPGFTRNPFPEPTMSQVLKMLMQHSNTKRAAHDACFESLARHFFHAASQNGNGKGMEKLHFTYNTGAARTLTIIEGITDAQLEAASGGNCEGFWCATDVCDVNYPSGR